MTPFGGTPFGGRCWAGHLLHSLMNWRGPAFAGLLLQPLDLEFEGLNFLFAAVELSALGGQKAAIALDLLLQGAERFGRFAWRLGVDNDFRLDQAVRPRGDGRRDTA